MDHVQAAGRAFLVWSSCVGALAPIVAQQPGASWSRPPAAIAQLVDAPGAPDAALSPQRHWLVLTTHEPLPSLEVVARPHLKLAGLRIDPKSHGPQLGTKTMAMTLVPLEGGAERAIDVPLPGDWSGPLWSADDRAFALLRRADGGAELWIADPATAAPRRIEGVRVNTVLGAGVQWLPNQQQLLVTTVVPGPAPERPSVPPGPQVQEAVPGQQAPVRTYQDLLQDAHDEVLLEHYGQSQLVVVDAGTGKQRRVGSPGLFDRAEPSPDGAMLLVERVERPFSFVIGLQAFPRVVELLDLEGRVLRSVARTPLQDAVPIGGVPAGPRGIDWAPVLPHTLVWTEALDGGDPRRSVPFRDQLMRLAEPAAQVQPWFRTEHRASGLQWGSDGQLVLAVEFDRKARRQRLWRHDAIDLGKPAVQLQDRSTQDAYGDPGRAIGERTADGRSVLRMAGSELFLAGEGASPQGNRPFVDRWNLDDGKKERLFQAEEGRHETFVGFLDSGARRLLLRSESPTEPPSLVVLDRRTATRTLLRAFPDPAHEATRTVQKRLIKYERADGVPLSGTLYLPPGYREGDRVPCLVWAYPLEYSQASDAGQVRATPNRYLRLAGSSHLFLLLAGYAVFDDAAMPIVGPQRSANDTFVLQLQQNAQAAVDALGKTGCIDTARLAVAGHSYGAFMTANVLAHTDLFACGIARSGAYNRTLTPFGFQNEDRTYWEAPEIYQAMSPFAHAQRINEPLLLIHGSDDNNPGTFPIQSHRMFAALKGHGATARLCMLPHESHGYRGRENVLQCLAEMCAWLDRHCGKPK